ncbi:hypothetical protein RF11_11779 [Thelohanellus kitauei]|uniref:Uncharacterized protein n=1 Tax=Thelohanellus kitauei TaxID=669202 RepID=A0A0C2I666_THEKT|nr:hypothetical protein RF11_11779 [Thelohanellus kitauei]
MTLSLDAGGKYVVEEFHANFKTFNSFYRISGLYQTFWVNMGVFDKIDSWDAYQDKLVTEVKRLPKLKSSEMYSMRFLRHKSLPPIYLLPDTDQSYQDFPEYAEIQISLINARGNVKERPAPIKDIKYDLQVDVFEPDTDRAWRSLYAFSDDNFTKNTSPLSNSEVLGFFPSISEPEKGITFLTFDINPYESLHFYETFTRKAYFIQITRKKIEISLDSQCLKNPSPQGKDKVIFARYCNKSELDSCKRKSKKKTNPFGQTEIA